MFKSFRIIFFFLISFGSFLIVFNTSKILNQNTSNQLSIMNINTQKLFNKNLNNHHFSAIDSSIINNLYSQKKIDFDEGENTSNLNQRTIIKIKTKPINPSIIEAKLALKNDIQSRVRNEMDVQQREYYLHQQMKTIQEE